MFRLWARSSVLLVVLIYLLGSLLLICYIYWYINNMTVDFVNLKYMHNTVILITGLAVTKTLLSSRVLKRTEKWLKEPEIE